MTNLFDQIDSAAGPRRYAQVALEQGIDVGPVGLTYVVPPELADLAPGERVRVPLGRGNKPAPGYVLRLTGQAEVPADLLTRVKPILGRDAQALRLTDDLMRLAQWMAGYYCAPLGMVLATLLPAAVKKGAGTIEQTWVRLTGDPLPATDDHEPPVKLSKLQRKAYDLALHLARSGEPWIEVHALAEHAQARSVAPIRELVKKGLLSARKQSTVRAEWDKPLREVELPPPEALKLTEAQRSAVEKLLGSLANGFSAHLLHGVTGSGKTEVYLRVIEALLAREPSAGAIVLVPEIALTPQTAGRFYSRFDSVAVLHSGLTAAQRHDQWRRLRAGRARIVVGARSAVFAPLANTRLIVVDEEHDSSYKQDQLPRYQARDVAIKRAQLLGVPVILGSATPSLESWYNAAVRGVYQLIDLPQRVSGMRLPEVRIVDMKEQRRKRYQMTGRGGVHLLSIELENHLRRTLKQPGAQAMLLLNRRGYANYIACPDQNCGWMMTCEFCDVTMVYHKDRLLPSGGYVSCHHCTAEQMLPSRCPLCEKKVTVFGLGTQRVEEELANKFPDAPALRMDSDAMRTARDYEQALERFRQGEARILVGTQMIAKGLDFPHVQLVGVISADTALNLPDFRASERTFQLIAQVAGRAGRRIHVEGDAAAATPPATVIVQSFSPADPAIVLASKLDYAGFAAREIAVREQVGLPPVSRMARIVIRHRDHVKCHELASALAAELHKSNEELGTLVRLRGPMPCPIARIASFHRQQIELIAPPPEPASRLQKLLTALRNARLLISDARTAVDVDPVSLL